MALRPPWSPLYAHASSATQHPRPRRRRRRGRAHGLQQPLQQLLRRGVEQPPLHVHHLRRRWSERRRQLSLLPEVPVRGRRRGVPELPRVRQQRRRGHGLAGAVSKREIPVQQRLDLVEAGVQSGGDAEARFGEERQRRFLGLNLGFQQRRLAPRTLARLSRCRLGKLFLNAVTCTSMREKLIHTQGWPVNLFHTCQHVSYFRALSEPFSYVLHLYHFSLHISQSRNLHHTPLVKKNLFHTC